MKTKTGAERIAEERQRQITVENYRIENDSRNGIEGLILAAEGYSIMAMAANDIRDLSNKFTAAGVCPRFWPWHLKFWKPGKDNSIDSRIRELEKAGALIAAAIDVLLYNKTKIN